MTLEQDITTVPGLQALAKAKQKLTLYVPGGAFMGVDSHQEIVTRGIIEDTQHVMHFGFSAPRAKKLNSLNKALKNGCIILKGHVDKEHDVFASQYTYSTGNGFGCRSFIIDGKKEGRFLTTVEGDTEGEAVIAFLKKHLLFHTIQPDSTCVLQYRNGGADAVTVNENFAEVLVRELGPPVDLSEFPEPEKRVLPGKPLFTPKQIEQLKSRQDKEPEPQFKLFLPEGSMTWVVFSMEENDDTLWVVADIGMGCVEYGTASLAEIQSLRGKMIGLPVERDIHFDPKKHTLSSLLARESLSGV